MKAHIIIRLLVSSLITIPSVDVLCAQHRTQPFTEESLGGPPKPPFIRSIDILAVGELVTDQSIPPAGLAKETIWEELRAETTPGGPAGEVLRSVKSLWDGKGHLIDEVTKDSTVEMHTTTEYNGNRPISITGAFLQNNQVGSRFWEYWSYDSSGRISDYRRGSGIQIQNHYTNIRRDAMGRLISYEYREGPDDQLTGSTEYRYADGGKTIEVSDLGRTGEVHGVLTETLNDQGHVVIAVKRERDWRTKQMQASLRVEFRYDSKGRLIEQNTADHALTESGVEHELLPGKISIAYDDFKHTKTTSYSGKEGSLTATIMQNVSGSTIGYVGGTKAQLLEMNIQCDYDKVGNWTSCWQLSRVAGIEKITRIWRKRVVYLSNVVPNF